MLEHSGSQDATVDEADCTSVPGVTPRRLFVKRAAAAALAGAVTAPVLGATVARADGTQPAYTDAANAFTASQTIDSGTAPALAVAGPMPTDTVGSPILQILDHATQRPVLSLGNLGTSTLGGRIMYHSQNGLGPGGLAWSEGVDNANPAGRQDYYISKRIDATTERDVMYLWHLGASDPAVDFFPAGYSNQPTASVTIHGKNNAHDDPSLLDLSSPVGLNENVLRILKIGEAQPTFAVDKIGKHKWGPGGDAATDTDLYRGGVNSLQTHSTFTCVGLYSSGLSNFDRSTATSAALYTSVQGATAFVLQAGGTLQWGRPQDVTLDRPGANALRLSASGTPGANERLRIDATGVGFFGATPVAQPTLAPAANNLQGVIALANDIRARLIKYGLAA